MTVIPAGVDRGRVLIALAARTSPAWWLAQVLPSYVGATGKESPTEAERLFGPHHLEFWGWVWGITAGVRSDAWVSVWGRGEAKSTSAELAVVALGARRRRSYCIYVSATQDQADDHVGNIAAMLESSTLEAHYPAMAERLVGKYGASKGWRRNRVRTSTGFTADALGLDTAARGIKLDEHRPDLIVLDDIDEHSDSPAVIDRKVDAITKRLLPAGSTDATVLAIQNLVSRDGVFAQLADGRARWLAGRTVSGPIPAVHDLVTRAEPGRDVVVSGRPSWPARTLEDVQAKIDDWGLRAFLAEAQHEFTDTDGALWSRPQLAHHRRTMPARDRLTEVVVGVDPSGTTTGDAQGIIVTARDLDGIVWVLEDGTISGPPAAWGARVCDLATQWEADRVIVETNYGGEMAVSTIVTAARSMWGPETGSRPLAVHAPVRASVLHLWTSHRLQVDTVVASRGKKARAEPVAALYGRPGEPDSWGQMVAHTASLASLEDEMTTWTPTATWSPNRVDALVWAVTALTPAPSLGRRRIVRSVSV